jgi:hypothetical protein
VSHRREHANVAALDRLIADITADARDDDEQLRAFWQALEGHIPLPADAFVIGEPVSVVRFDYEGTPAAVSPPRVNDVMAASTSSPQPTSS